MAKVEVGKDLTIITLDIETSPYVAYTWVLWDTSIGNDQVLQDATILSCAVKVLGDDRVYYMDTSAKRNVRDDKELVQWIHGWLEKADIVVTQNGKKFDIPRINARLALHGCKPPKPYLQVDTRAEARRTFKFMSNKLDWLAKELTDEQKSKHLDFPGFELWTECLAGNRKAWTEMRKYNMQDVRATEKLYLKLRPWMPNHPNTALIIGRPAACPKCHSTKLQARGWAYTQAYRYQRFQCTGCGGWTKSAKRDGGKK